MKLLHPQVEVAGGVALMLVMVMMGMVLSQLAMKCVGYDIGLMGEQLEMVRDDPSVKALVISFDTPGGSVRGLDTAGAQIREVRESGKRVYAYADTLCASAG